MAASKLELVSLRGYDQTVSYMRKHETGAMQVRARLEDADAVCAWVDAQRGTVEGLPKVAGDVYYEDVKEEGTLCGDGRRTRRSANNFGEPIGKALIAGAAMREFDGWDLKNEKAKNKAKKIARSNIAAYMEQVGSFRWHIDPHAVDYISDNLHSNSEFSVLEGRVTDTFAFVRSPRTYLLQQGVPPKEINQIIDKVGQPLKELLSKRRAKGCGRILVYESLEGSNDFAPKGTAQVYYEAAIDLLYAQDRKDFERLALGKEVDWRSPRLYLDNLDYADHAEGMRIELRNLRRLTDPYGRTVPLPILANTYRGVSGFTVIDCGARDELREHAIEAMHQKRKMTETRDGVEPLHVVLRRSEGILAVVDNATVNALAGDLPAYVAYLPEDGAEGEVQIR